MNPTIRKPISKGTWTRIAMLAVGAVAGIVGSLAADRAAEAGLYDPEALSWSYGLALTLGLIMGVSGVFAVVVSFSARATARALDPDGSTAPRPGQKTFYRQQGFVLVLAGLMMAAPVVANQLYDPVPRGLAIALMAGLVAASLIQTLLNLSVWNRADEMMRRMIAETGSLCFWLLQGLFFLWAAAEVLGLAPALSSWDLMTILMAVYLAVSAVAAMQRGFA